MTLPSVRRDLLMDAPSFNRVPAEPAKFEFSEPARSTKFTLLTVNPSAPVSSSTWVLVAMMVKIAWLREEASFIFVSATTLLDCPSISSLSASAAVVMGVLSTPSTKGPFVGCSRTFRFWLGPLDLSKRSRTLSI